MVGDQRTLLFIAIPVILGLEIWRRTLRHRAPRWMYVVSALLVMGIAGGVAYAQWTLSRTMEQISNTAASEKTSSLANGISSAMAGNAIAIACALAAIIVLAIATSRARGVPEGGPEARVVADQKAASSATSPSTPT